MTRILTRPQHAEQEDEEEDEEEEGEGEGVEDNTFLTGVGIQVRGQCCAVRKEKE